MTRGHRIDRGAWPEEGPTRALLEFLDRVHVDNGLVSLRKIAGRMHLRSPTGVGEMLRGLRLPADAQQLELLVRALGGGDDEVRKAQRLYERSQRDRPEADAPAWWSRSGYPARVADLAPTELLDREADLATLAAFCAGDEPYLRVLAEPWAGKTALMSWFVLHPPTRTEVISFFVLARDATQSTADACTDALIEQLIALTGERVDLTASSPTARDTIRRRLLSEAAARTARRGRRLVLVVDGIDEDRGSAPGMGSASIASLLPRHPPDGLSVIVAGRPDPPIPDDVSDPHPYRAAPTHELAPSRHAREKGRLAQRELDAVLNAAGDADVMAAREIIGLLCAADSALTSADMQELTGRPPYAIDAIVRGHVGRTVGIRGDSLQFTHDTLRIIARERIGGRVLGGHRARIHTWAEVYRRAGWPERTPPYLLQDYGRMLVADHDGARLTDLAFDERRQRRLATAFGGYRIAYGEVRDAQDLLLAAESPAIGAMARLAAHRRRLAPRGTGATIDLVRTWGRLGERVRAEVLAGGLHDPERQAWSFAELAIVTAGRGDQEEAEEIAATITHPPARDYAMAVVAGGDPGDGAPGSSDRWSSDQPEPVLRLLSDAIGLPRSRRPASRYLAGRLSGTVTRAIRATDEAGRAVATADLAISLSSEARARELAELAEAATRDVWGTPIDDEAVVALATAFARAGDHMRMFDWIDRLNEVRRATAAADLIEEFSGGDVVAAGVGLVSRLGGHDFSWVRWAALRLMAPAATAGQLLEVAEQLADPDPRDYEPDAAETDEDDLVDESLDLPMPGSEPLFEIDPAWVRPLFEATTRSEAERLTAAEVSDIDARLEVIATLMHAGRSADALALVCEMVGAAARGPFAQVMKRTGLDRLKVEWLFTEEAEARLTALADAVPPAYSAFVLASLARRLAVDTWTDASLAALDVALRRRGDTPDRDRPSVDEEISLVIARHTEIERLRRTRPWLENKATYQPARRPKDETQNRLSDRPSRTSPATAAARLALIRSDMSELRQRVDRLFDQLFTAEEDEDAAGHVVHALLETIPLLDPPSEIELNMSSLIHVLISNEWRGLAGRCAAAIPVPALRRPALQEVIVDAVHHNEADVVEQVLDMAGDDDHRRELLRVVLATALSPREPEDEDDVTETDYGMLHRLIEIAPDALADSETAAWYAVACLRDGRPREAERLIARALATDDWAPVCLQLGEIDANALRVLGDAARP